MNKNYSAIMLAVTSIACGLAASSFADSPSTSTCQDGTTSTATGKGACSHHGGVQKTAATPAAAGASPAVPPAAAPAAPAATAPATTVKTPAAATTSAATASATDPTGATAKCKDGTYSHAKTHSGACSKHGGVADWLPAK
jgi:hypothetical protein